MNILFKNARLIDPEAGTEDLGWLLVKDRMIAARGAGDTTQNAERVIDCAEACLAPGLVDIGVKIGEPGERHRTVQAAPVAPRDQRAGHPSRGRNRRQTPRPEPRSPRRF